MLNAGSKIPCLLEASFSGKFPNSSKTQITFVKIEIIGYFVLTHTQEKSLIPKNLVFSF